MVISAIPLMCFLLVIIVMYCIDASKFWLLNCFRWGITNFSHLNDNQWKLYKYERVLSVCNLWWDEKLLIHTPRSSSFKRSFFLCLWDTSLSLCTGFIQLLFQWLYIYFFIFRSVMATVPGHIIINCLACFSGLVVFAYYTDAGCDPLKAGYIPSPNHVNISRIAEQNK